LVVIVSFLFGRHCIVSIWSSLRRFYLVVIASFGRHCVVSI